ncbi:hypothetical protein ABIA96_002368 [Bradyrhizobium sp. LB11.1]
MKQQPRLSSSLFESQTHLRILAAQFARALPNLPPSRTKRAQGRPGADLAPAVRCAKGSAGKPHSSIQVVPITRPSLRSGLTAYAVLSREPSSFWPPSLRELTMWLIRLDAPHLRESLTVATTAWTTRFCRTHGPPVRRIISRRCRHCLENAGETKPNSAARRHAVSGSQGLPALPAPLAPNAAASTASPAREQDDSRSPLKDEPGWATHTPFPNFDKVEYFCEEGLTRWRVFCPTG